MEELKELKIKITEELETIRNKKTKNANDFYNYEQLQKKLREIYNVMIYLKEMNK